MIYPITPVPKPRPRVTRKGTYIPQAYQDFKLECQLRRVVVPKEFAHVIFVVPMPKSWPAKKKAEHDATRHNRVPDVDNYLKALMDATMHDDSEVWDIRVSKLWGYKGSIIIVEKGDYDGLEPYNRHFVPGGVPGGGAQT